MTEASNKLSQEVVTEFVMAVNSTAWNIDIFEFAKRLDRPHYDPWVIEKFRAFQALSDTLKHLSPALLLQICNP
jgi:hypothetical protein